MEAKHTAGPWKLEYIGKTVRVVTDEPGADYGDDVAVLPNTEQCTADAAFIVRACNAHDELVEAAKSAEAIFARQKWVDGSTDPEAAALRKLRTALASAGAA